MKTIITYYGTEVEWLGWTVDELTGIVLRPTGNFPGYSQFRLPSGEVVGHRNDLLKVELVAE